MSAGTWAPPPPLPAGPEGGVWAAPGPASTAQSRSAITIRVACLAISTPPWFQCRSYRVTRDCLPVYRVTLAPHLADQVRQLRDDELLQREPAGIGRARQGEEDAPLDYAALRAREHRRRADLLVGEHAEQLAEPREPLVEERLDRLVRRVAARDPGASREDEGLDRRRGATRADDRRHLGGLVLDDGVARDAVARRFQELPGERPAR